MTSHRSPLLHGESVKGYTVCFAPSDVAWIRQKYGGDNFSRSVRLIIWDHRRREKNRKAGHVKGVVTRLAKRRG
jgi:hypothetical protein